MAKKKTAVTGNSVSKESILKTISDQLHTALSTIKENLGEKKFEKRIKESGKVIC